MNAKTLAGLTAILFAQVAVAENYRVVQTDGDGVINPDVEITDAANVATEDGVSPSSETWCKVPSSDTLFLSEETPDSRSVRFSFPQGGGAITQYLCKVIGPQRLEMLVRRPTTAASHSPYTLFVRDPNEFLGAWRAMDQNMTLVLPGTSSFTPRLARLESHVPLKVEVPETGTSARIGLLRAAYEKEALGGSTVAAKLNGTAAVHGWGSVMKTGAGDLEIEAADGKNERVHVLEGSLTLDGRAEPQVALQSILDSAWLHLDASRIDTMKTYRDEDGRQCVTNWSNLANGDVKAWFPAQEEFGKMDKDGDLAYQDLHPPFISSVRSPTGLPYMDFGSARTYNVELTGPMNGMLCMTPCDEVREVFVVRWFTQSDELSSYNSVVGHMVKYPLHTDGMGSISSKTAGAATYGGDFTFNGVKANWWDYPADQYTRGWSDAFLFNVATTDNISLNLLGSDRLYNYRTGGCRIGEVLIFTSKLSDAERKAVNSYLMKKWFGNYIDCDIEAVSMHDDTTICVPEGRVARIERLSVGQGVVKKGGGRLEVGELSPADAKLEIQGGSIQVGARAATVADDRPAANPSLWLDAQDVSTLEMAQEGGDCFVSRWNDKSGGDGYASVQAIGEISNRPRWLKAEGLATNVVDFGAGVNSASRVTAAPGGSSWMKFTPSGAHARSAFLVVRGTGKDVWGNKFDVSSGTWFMASSYFEDPILQSISYACAEGGTAEWTCDGAVECPYSTRNVFLTGNDASVPFYVLSFSASDVMNFDCLASDRGIQAFGGKQVAEVLVYDRELTLSERRQTEAYLLKRWKAQVHPCVAGVFCEAADSAPIVVSADSDLDVKAVAGGNGNIEKLGAGEAEVLATVATRTATDPLSYRVAGGALRVNYEYPVQPLFRFDATSDDSYFDTYRVGNYTFVRTWNDADGRDVSAEFYPCAVSKTNANFATATTAPGVTRRILDCNGWGRAGYHMSKIFWNVREAMAVEADVNGGRGSQSLFTSRNELHYLRSWGVTSGLLQNYKTSQTMTVGGYIAIDGEERPFDYALPEGYHVIDFGPTDDTTIDTIALDRESTGGGLLVGEQLAFAENLTSARRAYMTRYLRNKWFADGDRAAWTNDIGSVEIENGASLTLDGSDVFGDLFFAVGEITGHGQLVSSGIPLVGVSRMASDVSGALELQADVTLAEGAEIGVAPAAGSPMSVSGSLVLPLSATVALDLAGYDDSVVEPVEVLTAGTLVNAENVTQWQVVVRNAAHRHRMWSLCVSGSSVCAVPTKPGCLFIVR